jgi:hypothetical protein
VFVIPPWVSFPARDLLTRVLRVDPEDRLTLQAILEHPFCRPKLALLRGLLPGEAVLDHFVLSQFEDTDL